MANYREQKLKTNEKGTRMEQKQARNVRSALIAEMAESVFTQVEVVGNKVYGIVEFQDNEFITVEVSATIKALDFEV